MVKTRSHVNGGNCRKCCFSLFLAMGAVLALNLLQLRIFQGIKCSMFMDIFSSVVSWRRGVIDQRKGGGDRRMSRLLEEIDPGLWLLILLWEVPFVSGDLHYLNAWGWGAELESLPLLRTALVSAHNHRVLGRTSSLDDFGIDRWSGRVLEAGAWVWPLKKFWSSVFWTLN